jgi:beta-1,4-mannosyl-glycoprotein beta-1,4-N-acetylglucosaminyltransferase
VIFDCFTFYSELDVLEIRLHELQAVVDAFVLVEATRTFSGQDKPLVFDQNRQRFDRFANKIRHVVVDDMPLGPDPWLREAHLRNAILRGIQDAGPADTILVSDVDEIPRSEIVSSLRASTSPVCLAMPVFYYRLNCRNVSGHPSWPGTVVHPRSSLGLPEEARTARVELPRIEEAGWHFSHLGNAEAIAAKLQTGSHIEYAREPFTSSAHIEAAVRSGLDLYGRPGFSWKFVPIDESYPAFVRGSLERFAPLIASVSPA